jgi:outer membrane receptor for ferrienterochelin and colicins
MFVPHYTGYISQDILVQSNPFFELNAKVSYSLKKSPNIELSLGVMNIFNSYQKDFDIGINRDAGYIYGPSRPLTTMFSIKIEA